jgi:hypothetical protein
VTAAAYLATVVVRFHRLVHAIYWDSDAASALVLAERLRGHGPVSIPHFGWWTSLWWLLATRGLPGHVQLWEATGYAFAVAGAGLVGWATGKVAGRWAGVTAAAVTLVVGPLGLRPLLTVNYHVSTPFTAVVLAAYLVVLARGPSRALAAAAVGLLAGANAASDPLLWLAGVFPFAAACAVLATATRRRDVWAPAAVTLAVTVISAVVTDAVMHGLGYHIISVELRPAPLADLVPNFVKLGREVALFGGANYAAPGAYPRDPLRPLVALLVLAAVTGVILSALKAITQRSEPATRAYACYWAAATLLVGLGYVASSQGSVAGSGSFLYMLTLAPAAGAGVAVLTSGSRRGELAVALAVAVVGAVNIAAIVQGRADNPQGTIGRYMEPLTRVLQREGVTRGYAGYWDAANLTWQSGMRLLVAPVHVCGPPSEPTICSSSFFTIRSWYEEQPGPSFLIIDPETGFITRAPPEVAHASASYRFGPLTVYVFPYDLARHIRRTDPS